jgi:hypothetical protein
MLANVSSVKFEIVEDEVLEVAVATCQTSIKTEG